MDSKRGEDLDTDNVDSFFLPGGILDTPGIDTERPSQDANTSSIGLLDIDIGLDLGLAPGVGTRHTRASTSRFVSSEQQHATPPGLAEKKKSPTANGSSYGDEDKPVQEYKAQQWLLDGINPLAPEFTPSFPSSVGEEKSPELGSSRQLPDFFADTTFDEEEFELEPSPASSLGRAPISRPVSNSSFPSPPGTDTPTGAPLSAVERIQQELAARQAQMHRDVQQQQRGFSAAGATQPQPPKKAHHQHPSPAQLASVSSPSGLSQSQQQRQQRRAQAHQQRLAKQRQQLQLQQEKERDLQAQMAFRQQAQQQQQQQQQQQRYRAKEASRGPLPAASPGKPPTILGTPPLSPGQPQVPPSAGTPSGPLMGGTATRRQERSTKQTWQQQQRQVQAQQAQAHKASTAAYSGSKNDDRRNRSPTKKGYSYSDQTPSANTSSGREKSEKSKAKKEDDAVFQGLLAPTATKARRSRVSSQEVEQSAGTPLEDTTLRNRKATAKKSNKSSKADKNALKESSKSKTSKKEQADLSNQASGHPIESRPFSQSGFASAAEWVSGPLQWWLSQSPQLFGKQGTLALVVLALHQVVSLAICLVGAILAGVFALLLLVGHLHHYALRETLRDFQVALCFVFPYSFRFTMTMAMEWAPHWAPVCLWYAFLVQIFCTGNKHKKGCSRAKQSWLLVVISRLVLPLLFIAEGVSGRSYLLELSGSELLLLSFLLAAIRMRCLLSPIFMVSWALQVIAVSILGPEPLLQYCQLLFALTSLHTIVFFDYLYHGRMCRSQSFPRSTYELSGFAQIGAQLSAVSRSTINH
mmetsp:Transcript_6953/g.9326  ORF Transcript_6953/g.9326 Transcript_6953/m.9326 type:complete len:808 (+) Transcript_6953:118-2541(+)